MNIKKLFATSAASIVIGAVVVAPTMLLLSTALGVASESLSVLGDEAQGPAPTPLTTARHAASELFSRASKEDPVLGQMAQCVKDTIAPDASSDAMRSCLAPAMRVLAL